MISKNRLNSAESEKKERKNNLEIEFLVPPLKNRIRFFNFKKNLQFRKMLNSSLEKYKEKIFKKFFIR